MSGTRGPSFELRMACRYLVTRRREGPVALVTLLCTTGVFTGVAALVVALALTNGIQGHVRKALLGSNPHVLVMPEAADRGYTMDDVAAIESEAKAMPGVVSVTPFTSQNGLLTSDLDKRGKPVEVKGLDPTRENRRTGLAAAATSLGWERLIADGVIETPVSASPESDEPLSEADLAPREPPAALLGEKLADDLGVAPGDTVRLVTAEVRLTAVGAMPRSRAFKVAGLLKTGYPAFDETFVIVNLRRLSADPAHATADGVAILLDDPMKAPEMGRELAGRLGRSHVVRDWTWQFGQLMAAFKWEKLLMVLAVGLIGLVAGFNIFTILTLNVTARVADIGILSAIGASRGTITRIFLWMGLLLGGAGTLGGVAAGALIAAALDRWQLIRLDASVYLLEHVPFETVPADLAVVAAGMLLVSFLATIAPARAAAALDPVVALRNA